MSFSRKLQIGALGGLLMLAGCGGSAAPASSAAPPSAAAAKPSTAAVASAPASVAASAKPAASGAPATSGSAAAKPAALPAGCPSPSAAPAAAAASGAAAKPAASAAAPASAAAKPQFTPQTDVIGEAAPGPYTENGRVTEVAGTPVKLLAPGTAYTPNAIVVKAGDNVTLNVTNCSTFAHTFISPGVGLTNKTDVPTGGDVNITFKAPDKAGKYMFWCTVEPPSGLPHAARGQTGEIIVQ